MKKTYDISIEGYVKNDVKVSPDIYLGKVKSRSFKKACKQLVKDLCWVKSFYNERNNTFNGAYFIEGVV